MVERTEENSVPSSELQNGSLSMNQEELQTMVADAVRKELDLRRKKQRPIQKKNEEVMVDA